MTFLYGILNENKWQSKKYWNICVNCAAVAAQLPNYNDDDDDREIDALQIPCAVMFCLCWMWLLCSLFLIQYAICIDIRHPKSHDMKKRLWKPEWQMLMLVLWVTWSTYIV